LNQALLFVDSTVYYRRVAPVTAGILRWNSASSITWQVRVCGYNQSHYYQHLKSTTTIFILTIQVVNGQFSAKPNTITIIFNLSRVSGTEDNHFSVGVNGEINIASACLGILLFSMFRSAYIEATFLIKQIQPQQGQVLLVVL
jgi:hypothetical protein